ncbi:MAG: hypothetical protein H0W82_04100 [Actinobacteria bacterium]|nr:hypothetical protein [Actinomycetota bacterium]
MPGKVMDRQTLLRRGALALPGLLLTAAVARTILQRRGSPVRAEGTQLGVYSDESGGHTLSRLEFALGRRFTLQRINAAMTFDIPSRRDQNWADDGYRIYHNANAETVDAMPWGGGWASIAHGSEDDYFHRVAAALRAGTRFSSTDPFDLSLHHEQGVTSGAQCGVGCNGTPEDYKAFYRHVSDLFHQEEATIDEGGPLRLVWTPTVAQFTTDGAVQAAALDPDLGPDGSSVVGSYYHLLGVDMYSRLTTGGLSIADPTAALAIVSTYAMARGVPFVIGEYGCQDGSAPAQHERKAEYLTTTATALKSFGTGPGGCEYWCYSHIGAGQNWLDSSPESLAAFTAIGQDPWFA